MSLDHITTTPPRACWHCGEPTDQVELHFEAPLHPGACTAAKWREYIEETT